MTQAKPDTGLPAWNHRFCYGLRARQILTMSEPPVLEDGLIWVHRGVIHSVGPYARLKGEFSAPIHDLGSRLVIPGLINAHTHLELSHLAGQTRAGQGFTAWVKSLISLPLKAIDPEAVADLVQNMLEQGQDALGDISGHNPAEMVRIHEHSRMPCRLFLENIGQHRKKPREWPRQSTKDHVLLSAAGHALYSTHPGLLQAVKAMTAHAHQPFSLHLAEHAGEVDLLSTARGPFAQFLQDRLLPSHFTPPGQPPVAYADQLGLLDSQTLAVHCVHLEDREIRLLRDRGVHVCLCPRSNAYIACGRAPAETLHHCGVPLSLGTDGLCSNQDLNLWLEAEALATSWQGNLSLTELVTLITINPARALGLETRVGSLHPGKLGIVSLVPESLHHALPL